MTAAAVVVVVVEEDTCWWGCDPAVVLEKRAGLRDCTRLLGSDLLSAITATFEKMRSEGGGGGGCSTTTITATSPELHLQHADGGLDSSDLSEVLLAGGGGVGGGSVVGSLWPCDDNSTITNTRSGGAATAAAEFNSSGGRGGHRATIRGGGSGGGDCKLYRDPSLHRRTPHLQHHHHSTSTSSTTLAPSHAVTATASMDNSNTECRTPSRSPTPRKGSKSSASVKRTDSLTKSEKTVNNLKEKSEKRCRELKRPETHEGLEEKKPKEMRHDVRPEEYLRQVNSSGDLNKSEKTRRLSTDVRHRRHNVKELKEKFEQNIPKELDMSAFNNNMNNNNNGNGVNSGGTNNNRRSGNRRSRSNIKRRHTVGGTKDLGKVVALQKALLQWQQLHGEQKKAIMLHQQQQHLTPETLEQLIAFEPWEARERLGASSPDLPHLLDLLMPGQEQQQHRRLSVREPWVLQPVLESHV